MMRRMIVAGACALASVSLTLSACAADNSSLLGQSEPSGYATKTVVIGADTSFVNIDRGDVVKFIIGDKSFSWSFATPGSISEVTLNEVAPAGMLDHTVKVYIKRIPIYDGG